MNMNTRHLLLTERDIRIKLVVREMHGYSKRTAFELSLHLASKQNNCLKKVSQFIFLRTKWDMLWVQFSLYILVFSISG